MRLGLASIVKNESARITRMLESVSPYISAWVITDTGSSDGTAKVIEDFFRARNIEGYITHVMFEDWSQARNANLNAARESGYNVDYWLLVDADMELIVKDRNAFMELRYGPSYDMYQVAGTLHYQNRRLVSDGTLGGYIGATHEFLGIPTAGLIGESVAYFKDHADGANRPGKFERDIRLLIGDLEKDPNNERAMFYLANSYRDAGMPTEAAEWFKKRVEAGGWDEEVWQAQVNYAHCQKDLGNEDGFVNGLLKAYDMRKERAESMYDLAKYYREAGKNELAMMAAGTVADTPLSKDTLFVNKFVYDVGIKEEISIAAFYVKNKRRLGYQTCSKLAMNKGPYDWVKHGARDNLIHYLEPLSTFCPSFKWEQIPFTPPQNWIAMNPSITRVGPTPTVNVRCVNYRIDEWGRYLIRGVDGTANQENPINTRNFILARPLDGWGEPTEVLPPPNMPCKWPLVIGFEDMRLIYHDYCLWSSSTVRQLHTDGNCEQVLTRLAWSEMDMAYRHTDMKRMLRMPRQTEKNWAPVVTGGDICFMHRPGELVNTDGVTVRKHDVDVAVDNISGSSQLVPFKDGWLAVTHEARHFHGKPVRYYTHRFVYYTYDFKPVRFSLPFFFHDRQIEFVGGMCWEPDTYNLMISYGCRDEDARIATVSAEEVEKFVWLEQ